MSPDDLALSTYGARAFAEYEDGLDAADAEREAVDPDACRETVGCECAACVIEMAGGGAS